MIQVPSCILCSLEKLVWPFTLPWWSFRGFAVHNRIGSRWTGRWVAKLHADNAFQENMYCTWMNAFFWVVTPTNIPLQMTRNQSQVDAWCTTTLWGEGLYLQNKSKRGAYLMHPGIRGFLDTSEPPSLLQKEARTVRQATAQCSVIANNFWCLV